MDGGTEGGETPNTTPEEDAGKSRDSGKRDGTATTDGEVTIENLSFAGTVSTGTFTFIVTNGSSKLLHKVNEVRVKFAEGEIVFTPSSTCTKLTIGDDLYLAPGATSKVITMNVESLDLSSGYVTFECGGTASGAYKTSGPTLSSGSSIPEALTIKGIYDDAAKWTATATVE